MPVPWNQLAIILIVSVDNAILAGLLAPAVSGARRTSVLLLTGGFLAITQVLLAMGVGRLLLHTPFRILLMVVLAWMSIRTLIIPPRNRALRPLIWTLVKVLAYTTMGNLDNLLWVGVEFKQHIGLLLLFSFVTIPLFVVVALFLANQNDRYHWIRIAGSGMMAWTAGGLYAHSSPSMHPLWFPQWLVQGSFSLLILAVGWGLRLILRSA